LVLGGFHRELGPALARRREHLGGHLRQGSGLLAGGLDAAPGGYRRRRLAGGLLRGLGRAAFAAAGKDEDDEGAGCAERGAGRHVRYSSRNRGARMVTGYRCTRPEASPPISFSTSATPTRLKSPEIECLRQLAATANSSACRRSSYAFSP